MNDCTWHCTCTVLHVVHDIVSVRYQSRSYLESKLLESAQNLTVFRCNCIDFWIAVLSRICPVSGIGQKFIAMAMACSHAGGGFVPWLLMRNKFCHPCEHFWSHFNTFHLESDDKGVFVWWKWYEWIQIINTNKWFTATKHHRCLHRRWWRAIAGQILVSFWTVRQLTSRQTLGS